MTGQPQVKTPDELAAIYQQLPKSQRWQTKAGSDFLLMLSDSVPEYGYRTCATALGVSSTAIQNWLRRPVPRQFVPYPAPHELRRLQDAWKAVTRADHRGTYVRRGTYEYLCVHLALVGLTRTYDIGLIATELGTERRRLRRFLTVPPQ